MALLQNQIQAHWDRYNRRRALTGFGPSYQETRGTMDSILGAAAEKDIQEARLRNQYNLQNRQLSLQEEQAKNADKAANISGVANLGQLGLTGYLGYKTLTKGPSALETASANYLKSLTPGATASPVAAAGVGSGGAGILTGAGSGATVVPEVGSLAAYDSALMAGAAEGVGSTAGLAAGAPGLLSIAGPAAAAVGAGQLLGKPVSKLLGTHEKTTGDVMSIGGGAAVGFAVGGPIGGLVGAALGGLASLF